jgi:hypothetical protein
VEATYDSVEAALESSRVQMTATEQLGRAAGEPEPAAAVQAVEADAVGQLAHSVDQAETEAEVVDQLTPIGVDVDHDVHQAEAADVAPERPAEPSQPAAVVEVEPVAPKPQRPAEAATGDQAHAVDPARDRDRAPDGWEREVRRSLERRAARQAEREARGDAEPQLGQNTGWDLIEPPPPERDEEIEPEHTQVEPPAEPESAWEREVRLMQERRAAREAERARSREQGMGLEL